MARTPIPVAAGAGRGSGALLAVLLTGQAMATMDNSIVAVAAQAIRTDLAAGGAAVQLVLAGYTLAFGVLVVTGARLGDLYGHRRMFLLGLAGFTTASLACGLAPTATALIVARVAQGAAAALMVPQVLSLIQLGFDGPRRGRAVGLYSMVLALGVAAGQIAGGLIVTLDVAGASWRPAFLVNVPVGVALLAFAGRALPRSGGQRHRLDLIGVAILSTAMTAVVLPLVIGRVHGWPLWSVLTLVAGGAGLAVFLRYERRLSARAGEPLLVLAVLRPAVVRAGLLACCVVMGCYAAFLFTLTLHLQDGLGFSPLHAGAVFVPYAAGFAACSLTVARLPVRVGAALTVAGPLAFAVAAGVLALLARDSWPHLLSIPVLLAGGAGHAAGFSPLVTRMAAVVPPALAGSLSGLVSTGTLLASVLGVAALGGVYLAVTGADPSRSGSGFAAVAASIVALLLLCAAAARRASA